MKPTLRYLSSIHDVMPETLDRVEAIFSRLSGQGMGPVTLLVVPGRSWQSSDLDRLRGLVERGAELAGHGWVHEVESIRGVKHRLHSALISKRVAEHLALDAGGCIDLMQRCHAWFSQHGLPEPALYVPPAWAMGPVRRSALEDLPFERFETIAGVYDARRREFRRLPLLGFEVEAGWQRVLVGRWNAVNLAWGRRADRPIRLGVHPNDLSLLLSDQLERLIAGGGAGLSYRAIS
jgi:predicted deacetylase